MNLTDVHEFDGDAHVIRRRIIPTSPRTDLVVGVHLLEHELDLALQRTQGGHEGGHHLAHLLPELLHRFRRCVPGVLNVYRANAPQELEDALLTEI